MTDTELALLRAICEHPAEDTPRLMYADHLEGAAGVVPCGKCRGTRGVIAYPDEGRPITRLPGVRCTACRGSGSAPDGRAARAEFVRVQCELARLPLCGGGDVISRGHCATCARVLELRRREGELFSADWLPDFGGQLREWYFGCYPPGHRPDRPFSFVVRRGFVEAVTLSAADWLAQHETLFWHPDQTVECPTCEGESQWWQPHTYCPTCGNENRGTVDRPFVPTAQPITRVVLTTWPADMDVSAVPGGRVGERGWRSDRFPGVTFRLPGDPEPPPG